MHSIILNNIKIYTNHGCLPEEAAIGSEYRVDLEVFADLSLSASSDQLQDTVDYVSLNRIVKQEMSKRSQLLEHVNHRIITRILNEEPLVQKVKVSIAKINPPIGGDVTSVVVCMQDSRTA